VQGRRRDLSNLKQALSQSQVNFAVRKHNAAALFVGSLCGLIDCPAWGKMVGWVEEGEGKREMCKKVDRGAENLTTGLRL